MAPRRVSTIHTAASSDLLTSLANVKTDLNISSSSDDAYLTRLITAASVDAVTYCAREFVQETINDTFYLDAQYDALLLSRHPVASITSVTVDGTVLSSAYYTYDGDAGLLYKKDEDGKLTPWEAETTVVRFVGGYDTIPYDLEAAVISLIKARRAARERDPAVRSERIPDVYDVTYWVRGPGEADLPPDVAGTFDRYRNWNV